MKRKNDILDVVFLLDRSGSMANCEKDTIGGYNSYLKKQRKNKNTLITTILFDNEYEVLTERKPVSEVKDITEKEYFVRGCTALNDAIGKAIISLEQNNPNKVLFIITTDGLENASTEFRKKDIKALIEKHSNWNFLYIGANIDSYAEGHNIGITKDNIANYTQDKKGIKKLYRSLSKATCMMEDNSFNGSWKKELE